MERRTKNRHVARRVIGILALTGSVGLGAIGIAASAGGAAAARSQQVQPGTGWQCQEVQQQAERKYQRVVPGIGERTL